MLRPPSRFQQQTIWNAITGIAILIIFGLVTGAIWLLGKMFGFLQPVLVPMIVAGIIAYVIDPVVRFFQRRGMSRLWAVIAVFGMVFLIAGGLVAAVIPGIREGHRHIREQITSTDPAAKAEDKDDSLKEDTGQMGVALERELNEWADHHRDNVIGWALTEMDDEGNEVRKSGSGARDLDSFSDSRAGRMMFEYKGSFMETGKRWVTAGSSKILGFIGLLLGLIMVPIYLFYLLRDSTAIRARWHEYLPVKASPFKTELVSTLQEINGYLISFFRGQIVVAAIDGALVGITLMLIGLPYALLIGVFMAILGVIPYIGNIICLIPACIIGYLHAQGSPVLFGMGPWAYVFLIVAVFVVVQQINSLVTAPKIVGDSVGLHSLTVIFSMLLWSLVLGGFVGTLLAVPLTAALKVLFRRFVWERQKRYSITPEKTDWTPAQIDPGRPSP